MSAMYLGSVTVREHARRRRRDLDRLRPGVLFNMTTFVGKRTYGQQRVAVEFVDGSREAMTFERALREHPDKTYLYFDAREGNRFGIAVERTDVATWRVAFLNAENRLRIVRGEPLVCTDISIEQVDALDLYDDPRVYGGAKDS